VVIERESEPLRNDSESRRVDAERPPGHPNGALEPQSIRRDPRPSTARAEHALVERRVVGRHEVDPATHPRDDVPHVREPPGRRHVPPRDAVEVSELEPSRPRANEPVLAPHDAPLLDAHEANGTCAVRVAVGSLEVDRGERRPLLHEDEAALRLGANRSCAWAALNRRYPPSSTMRQKRFTSFI